jgi:polysaccharide biosynthesis protein PelA
MRCSTWSSGLLLLVIIAAASAVVRPVAAVDIEVPNREVKRRILALYDAREEKKPHLTRIHRFAEMPLNWLGYTVEYQDIGARLPETAEVQKYRAVFTWFQEPMAVSARVARFIDTAVAAGVRYVVIGEPLPTKSDGDPAVLERLHAHLGLVYTGGYSMLTLGAKIAERNPAMIGFERPLDVALPDHPITSVLDERTVVHLSLTTRTRLGTHTSPVVVTSPRGGYVASNFSIYYEPVTERTLWTLNPFQFFKQALGETRFPVPDTSTLSGRRIYFSQIDGDGWNNVSEIEGFKEAQVLSSEVVASELIERYPDLPVSVAVITGDVMPLLGGTAQAARVAKRLFALPQVEVASHTHTHPFDWGFFASYNRADEETKIESARL